MSACRTTSPSSLPRAHLVSRPAVCCGAVLPVCPCVVSFPEVHKNDTHDLLRTSSRGSSRGCNQYATRKLLPWNSPRSAGDAATHDIKVVSHVRRRLIQEAGIYRPIINYDALTGPRGAGWRARPGMDTAARDVDDAMRWISFDAASKTEMTRWPRQDTDWPPTGQPSGLIIISPSEKTNIWYLERIRERAHAASAGQRRHRSPNWLKDPYSL